MTMSTAAGFFTSSSSRNFLSPPSLSPTSLFSKGVRLQRFVILKVSCEVNGSKGVVRSECGTTSSSSSSSEIAGDGRSISTYKWCADAGSIGFLETAYSTYLKLAVSDVFCPMGGGSCNTVRTSGSDFSIFGPSLAELVVLKEHVGDSCLYCLASAALTFSLFFITIKDFGLEKIKKMLVSQLCTSLAIIALCTSSNAFLPVPSSLAATERPYVETEVTGESSPSALSLARHLHSIGAKLYGAFWCSHCVHQKQMFGTEAAKLLDYVECYPDGLKAGTKMAEACYDIDLQAFPSWLINGEVLSGEKQFPELAQLSGIKLEDLSQEINFFPHPQ